MYHALIEQMTMPDIDALSFDERLGLLVDRELTERDSKRLKTRLQTGQTAPSGVYRRYRLSASPRPRQGPHDALSHVPVGP